MLGLNRGNSSLDPYLRESARRLSFPDTDGPDADFPSSGRGRTDMPRHAFFPRLQTIAVNHDEPAAQSPAPLSASTAPQSSPGAAGARYPAPGGTMAAAAASAPVVTSPPLAPTWPSQSQLQEALAAARMLQQWRQARQSGDSQHPMTAQQLQDACAVERMLEQWRQARESQQRHQQALAAEAGRLQSQVLMLYTVDEDAAGYETKWEELHAFSQDLLLQNKDCKDDSKRLDQCNRLDDLSPFSFDLDSGQVTQEAASISTIMNREKISTESLMTVIKEIMWSTDFAIFSYANLRPRFVHLRAGAARQSRSSGAQTDFSQLLTMVPSFHCYSSATRRPSSFCQDTVARFQDHLGECCKWILELEQLVRMKDDKTFAETLESLSKVMPNVLDFLIHVASKVEHIHQSVETMRTQYLNDRRCMGDLSNPFVLKEDDIKPSSPLLAVAMIPRQLPKTSSPIGETYLGSYPSLSSPSVLPPSSMQTSPAPLSEPSAETGLVEKRCRSFMSSRNDVKCTETFYKGPHIWNTVTWPLEGSRDEVTQGHIFATGHYRLWNFVYGMLLDVSPLFVFGPRRVLYTTAVEGTFYLKFRYHQHEVTLPIDGREAWVYGLQNKYGTFEFDHDDMKYLDGFERWKMLKDFPGDYSRQGLCPNDLQNTPMGIDAARIACEILSEYQGELPASELVRQSCSVLLLYGTEASKFNMVLDQTIPSLSREKQVSITLEDISPDLCPVVRRWNNFGGVSLESCMWALQFPTLKTQPKLRAIPGVITSVDDALSAVNIIPYNRVPSPGPRKRTWKAKGVDQDAYLCGGRPHELSPSFARRWPYDDKLANNRPDTRFIKVGRNLEFTKSIRPTAGVKIALEAIKRMPK